MKSKWQLLLMALVLFGLVFHSSCKSEDECDFSILGTWSITINSTVPYANNPWLETLTFAGSDTSGNVTGWQYEAGQTGTYTVTNCSTVSFVFEYYGTWGYTYVPFEGTGTGDTMSGTMSYYDDDYGATYTGTWTGANL